MGPHVKRSVVNMGPGVAFTTLHFLYNFQKFPKVPKMIECLFLASLSNLL